MEIGIYLSNQPFSTLTEIARRNGYLTNTQQTQKFLDRLVDASKIHRVHWWEKTVYFPAKPLSPELLNTANYLRLKEYVFSKLNQTYSKMPELKEFMAHYKIEDFTSIPKKTFCKKPLPYQMGLDHENKNLIVLKYLQTIFLETHIRILENNYAEKNNIDEVWCGSKRQFRESRLYGIFSNLKMFLDKNWQEKNQNTLEELKEIAQNLDSDYHATKLFLSSLSKQGRHSSFYVQAMIADKMGKKDEFAEEHGMKISTVTKMVKKFYNKRGGPDLGLMYRYRRVEDASDVLGSPTDDISWYSEVAEARDDLNSTRFLDEKSDYTIKVKKRITRVFPKMQIY